MSAADQLAGEFLELVRAGATAPGVTLSPWPGLEFLRSDETMRRAATNYEPCLCIVAQGRKVAWLDEGEAVHYDPLHFLVVALPMPIDAEIIEATPEKPLLAVRIKLDVSLLTEVLFTTEPDARESLEPMPALASSPLDPRLLEAVVRLIRGCQDPLERRAMLGALQRDVLFRLAVGAQAAMLRQVVFRDHLGHRIVRAVRHVEQHYAEGLSIAQLASVALMGESTFHRAFREVTGTTPLRYIKRVRLHRARDMMLNEDLTAAEAGARVGYPSPSQFSRDYKSLFGESPRRSVAQLRNGRVAH